jgi:Co/Zn/Cd efflux system component
MGMHPERKIKIWNRVRARGVPFADTLQSLEFGQGSKVENQWNEKSSPGLEARERERADLERKSRQVLWIALGINFLFFLIEGYAGYLSGSMGLVADSIDMFADSLVYMATILSINAGRIAQERMARGAGTLQLGLGILGILEVYRRYLEVDRLPEVTTVISVSIVSMFANLYCVYLFWNLDRRQAHLQASFLFTANDVILNLGVISSAIFVYIFRSQLPDLIIASCVFFLIGWTAIRLVQKPDRTDLYPWETSLNETENPSQKR